MLSEDVAKELTKLKEERKESYSQVIRRFLRLLPEANLREINEHFDHLKLLIPQMQSSLELMRVITVRYYRLPRSEQKAKDDTLNKILKEAMRYTVKEKE